MTADSESECVNPGAGAKPPSAVSDVRPDRLAGKDQPMGNLFAVEALSEKLEYFALSRGKTGCLCRQCVHCAHGHPIGPTTPEAYRLFPVLAACYLRGGKEEGAERHPPVFRPTNAPPGESVAGSNELGRRQPRAQLWLLQEAIADCSAKKIQVRR